MPYSKQRLMIRKFFGWILIILGLFCVLGAFASMSVTGKGLDMLPYMLIWIYIFGFGGYRLIAIPKEEDVIAIWKKILVYFAVLIVCIFIAVIVGTICNNNLTLINWLFVILFIIIVESDMVKKWMLNIYYRKHPEKATNSTIEEKVDDIINDEVPKVELEVEQTIINNTEPRVIIKEKVMKPKLSFQQKVNLTLFILTGVFLITSIILFFAFVDGDEDCCLPWLIFSLLSAIPRILWWYFNNNQLSIDDNKKYGLAFLISGFTLCISPFYAVVSLFLGGFFTKKVFDKIPK